MQRMMVGLLPETKAYGGLLTTLEQPSSLPLSFQCTAGKDRTGWGAAVVLGALGVSREEIAADFVLTNECIASSGIYDGYIKQFRQIASKAGHPDLDLSPLNRCDGMHTPLCT